MENYGQDTFRDEKGRLQNGHPGLKKKGSIHVVAGDIRDKLADFLQQHIDELPGIWEGLPGKDKVKLFVDVAGFILPKQKDITISTEPTREQVAAIFDFESEDWVKEKQKNLFPEEKVD